MDTENGNRKKSTKGKVATERVQIGRSRGKKRKEKGKIKKSDNKREKKKDAWKEKFV
jgi:hypothetical protein